MLSTIFNMALRFGASPRHRLPEAMRDETPEDRRPTQASTVAAATRRRAVSTTPFAPAAKQRTSATYRRLMRRLPVAITQAALDASAWSLPVNRLPVGALMNGLRSGIDFVFVANGVEIAIQPTPVRRDD